MLGGARLRALQKRPNKGARRHAFHFDYFRNQCGTFKYSERIKPERLPRDNPSSETLSEDPQNRNGWTTVQRRRKTNKSTAPATIVEGVRGKVTSTQQRGRYFVKFRKERVLLKALSNIPLNFVNLGRRERRILRAIYYCVLPPLFSRLSLPEDKYALWKIEEFYYDELNRANLCRKKYKVVNRLPYMLRCYSNAERVFLSRQSSIEPPLEGSVSNAASARYGPFRDRHPSLR